KLQWKTDAMTAWSGVGMRRALRLAPRRMPQFTTLLQGAEKQYVENQMFAWGALPWALPIWWDGQPLELGTNPGDMSVLADTVDRDFNAAGGIAILIQDARTYETLQYESFTDSVITLTTPVRATWPAGSRLYPTRVARLLNVPKLTRIHARLATVNPEFTIVEPCDWPPATGLPMYRGLPVLEDSQDVTETADGSYDRQAFVIDNETGSIDVTDTALVGYPV